MDCGPAALKSLLGGYGINLSYGRLREACQTDLDGSSIDTIEQVACDLGLEAEQILLPADHLLLPEARALPAVVVVRAPNGASHFVVAWRRVGPLVQVMNPSRGRGWLWIQQFLDEVYTHTVAVDCDVWREWAGSQEFLGAIQ
jgi:ABC-type bacteriocin/lantibiotic exporter with double-glycine peptidase domain